MLFSALHFQGSGGIEKSHSCKWAKWIQWHALPHIQQSTQQRNKGYYPNLHGWDFSIPPSPFSVSYNNLVVVVLRSPIHANEPSEYNGMLYRTSNRVLNNGIKVIILICMDGTSQYHHHQQFAFKLCGYGGSIFPTHHSLMFPGHHFTLSSILRVFTLLIEDYSR